ncbi:Golgi apparatus protein 1 like protein [Argiope bruennichi]|uniref:Golgi apparatus protein 1 like protein n=1 Tax=Argiope bruennichi TaxID=94029 RepID=A0A8T0F8V3_ARGBR|nr:Golgi apparatus protein 1 like protein [Argiope bruennichi]
MVANIKDVLKSDNKLSFASKPRFKITTSSPSRIKLSETPECTDDIRHLCPTSILNNNFAVLDCLQNDKQREDADLSPQCHHLIWTFKRNLTVDNRFVTTAKHMCKKFLETVRFPPFQGETIECLSKQTEKLTPQCRHEILRIAELQGDGLPLIDLFFGLGREGWERFLENGKRGKGRVYRCY